LRIIAIYWDVLSMFKVCSNDTRGGISRIRLAAEKLGAASPIVFGNLSLSFLSIWVSLKEQDSTWAHMLLELHTAYRKVPDTHIKRLDVGYHETSRSIYCNLSATCRDVPRCAACHDVPKTSPWLPHWDVVAAIDRVVWRVRVRWPHIRMHVASVVWTNLKNRCFFGKVPDFVTWRIDWLVSNSGDAAKTHLSD